MSKEAKKKRGGTALLTLCLILLLNPNFNTVDILPDFIAYLILASLAARHADHTPFFAEARDGCFKLAAITGAKIPGMLVMFSNMSSGRDIVPLFALIFATLELIVLIPLISDTFSALFYIGERGNLPSTIRNFRMLGIGVSPDFLRLFTIVFVSAKAVLSVLPELCLLTFDTDTVMAQLRAIYPTTTVCSLSLVLLLGIVWATLASGYVRAIAREGGIGPAAMAIAGEEKLERLKRERGIKRKLRATSLLFISSVLIFDITFSGVNNGVNILPRFLFAIAMALISFNLFDSKKARNTLIVIGVLFGTASSVTTYFLIKFKSMHEYRDILDFDTAAADYEPVKICALIELAVFLLFMLVFASLFIRFVKSNTGVDKSSPGYGKAAMAFEKRMMKRTVIYLSFPSLIAIMKAVEVFLFGHPQLIYTDASNATVPSITASALPWFGFAIVAVCTFYVLYSYSYLTELKEEIALKYSDEYFSF